MTAAVRDTLRDDAIRYLQHLLRLDTTNPPGNEKLAADFIAGVLRDEGIESTILEAAPGRATLVARLNASNPTGRPVLLMGHTDVVGVEPEKWERGPFSGDLVEGWLWGRGALDMKSQVAAELAAFVAIKRSGTALERDLIFVAFADEEAGGEYGADWMWKNHRDLIDAEFAINEGGGAPVETGGKLFYTCQAGEKGSSQLRMTVTGTPGHASVPLPDTAMRHLGEALAKLHAWEPPTVLTAPSRAMLQTLGDTLGGDVAATVAEILGTEAAPWQLFEKLPLGTSELSELYAATRNTAVPTIISGGVRINVIPSEIVVDIDGRILPGQDPETFRQTIQEVVGPDVRIELISRDSGVESDPASPFFDAITATMAELQPDSVLMPYMLTGGTDAALLPGIKTYGFFPMLPGARLETYSPLVHGHNERIHIDDLAFGAQFIHDLIVRFCGSGA
jgi:acetylornithine deacetylase/succinyl-diaminopimelate desuccinylase-like protein